MDCHQILSGACNVGDKCFAIGSVEGINFTAYAAGCNIVILASTFERVQIIPGATHNYIRISALDCSTDTGKIAAAYENKVCIFEPTPLIHSQSGPAHGLEYRWVQTGSLQADSHISSLSWNLEGTRLLTGGVTIQMWHERITNKEEDPATVTFEIGGGGSDRGDPKTPNNEEEPEWECVWKCHTATPVHHMSFSPDGTLFATSGKSDRLVKIWYENKNVLFPNKSMDQAHFGSMASNGQVELNYGFVYIAHPRAVTHLSWRKTSKYMPKGSVSNMLVTSCLDNICRIWIETVLPDDGLVNMNQFDPLATQNPKFRTHRHKHRFMQRLKHMKTCFHIRRHAKHHNGNTHHIGQTVGSVYGSTLANGNFGQSPIPSLPSTYSVHDFHSYGYHGTGVTPGLHFHLAASINAETDIPLVPSMQSNDPSNQPNFILHWLNNKEMHFTMQAESILQELTRKVIEKEQMNNISSGTSEHNSDGHDGHEQSEPHQQQPHPSQNQLSAEEPKRRFGKSQKSFSHDESNSDDHLGHSVKSGGASQAGLHSHHSLSNTTSLNSLATDHGGAANVPVTDSLDMKIECLLRDWHHSPDLLFSIHPIDGSYLIWVVEWLDEYHPGSFRQAQISFSTRIPSGFPLGDAMSMSTSVNLYNTGGHLLHFREMVKGVPSSVVSQAAANMENPGDPTTPLPSVQEESEEQAQQEEGRKSVTKTVNANQNAAGDGSEEEQPPDILTAPPSPTISMVTKHANGTLNLWQLTFADKSKFTQVLSIGHVSRASGHRFRVNDITCHPVLPLLLTTSHHNIPDTPPDSNAPYSPNLFTPNKGKDVCVPTGFCSELILWRVDSVGPLAQSGGVEELARINSLEISAFSNVAWIPTLLPSTTLGSLSNSPSACFVASDGECLRVYQAVIDARTLLAEVSSSERKTRMMDSMVSLSSEGSSDNAAPQQPWHTKIKIVSQQSTARPGCIIQLDGIDDATHDWQNTQFLHVFQEQLITGERNEVRTIPVAENFDLGLMENQMSAIVDLQQNAVFEEPFYIVLIERTTNGSTIHMWRIVIASQPETNDLTESTMYVPDGNLVQDLDEPDPTGRRQSLAGYNLNNEGKVFNAAEAPHVSIKTTKVCTQELPLPEGVDVVHASPAAGHLSSSSIYPACFAPYIIVTACSDSTSRFWRCKIVKNGDADDANAFATRDNCKYEWCEWDMLSRDRESTIEVPGQPLHISAAYSGRIACAYKYGKSFTRPHKGDPDSRYVNLCVGIYECESTGGSEWILEDTIHLKNVHLPRINLDPHLDLSYLHDRSMLQKKQKLTQVIQNLTHDESRSPRNGEVTPDGLPKPSTLLAVPSFSTLQSLRRSIIENGNTCPLTQKHLVQLDWVSKEDGAHILTVAVGSKILLYTSVSSDLAQANIKAMKESQSSNRPLLRKASSLAQPHFNDEIRWMKLRQIELHTADGLPPLPMQLSWVRDGILVVGMDSEMHVYSQWKAHKNANNIDMEDIQDTRNLRDEDLRTMANENTQRRMASAASITHLNRAVGSMTLPILSNDKKRKLGPATSTNQLNNLDQGRIHDYMPDFGLFEASRIACPVLPQYHPKQLMELLNCGKIRWVKAILAHLVRCISGTYINRSNGNTSGDEENINHQLPEELTLDYAEITSIPPLPLWTLLAADREQSQSKQNEGEKKDYNDLFDSNLDNEDNLDDLLEDDGDRQQRFDARRPSLPSERQSLSHFGPRQGQLISRLLTHTHLPGLSSLDQMHLLALADTVATCNTDFAERFINDAAKTAISKENLTGVPENVSTDSLDDCGLRFLLAMKHYTYLLRCLPLAQRTQFQKQGVVSSNVVWAFHSESEEEILNLIPSYAKDQLRWATLKELGVGWWLRNNSLLRRCIEKLAKSSYQAKQDPMDAALYYIAMKKKSLVWGLYRSRRDEKMTAFFANNFQEDRWRKAALKNAFALLGKQRFEHAVAFFLLANSLNDAIEVCLTKLEDLQLALVITRLYEGEHDATPPSYRKLLYEEVLGCDSDGNNQDISRAHPDPFLRSMALWLLKDYSGSLNTLLLNNVGLNHPSHMDDDPFLRSDSNQSTNPNVFNFYIYLRTHPLLIRQYIASTAQEKKKAQVVLSGFSYSGGENTQAPTKIWGDRQIQIEDSITPLERQLYFTTAHGHFKAGCPALALEVLSKLPSKVIEPDEPSQLNSPCDELHAELIDTGIFSDQKGKIEKAPPKIESTDWGAPTTTATSNGLDSADALDWGAPVAKSADDDFKVVWDDDGEDNDSDENDIGLSMDANKAKENENSKQPSIQEDSKQSNGERTEMLDIMAQQLKFVACLKILMEELSTLATGFEVDGGQLRYQLYVWLEKEVEALKQLCNYSSSESDIVANEDGNQGETNDRETPIPGARPFNDRPTLHEILIAEKQDFEAKVQRAARRKRWLKANETLLRTLLSYCSLHGASGGGLASVRMELVLLLQELQQEKTQQQLLSPLPFPTTLPLLSACVAGNRTVIADPIRYLEAQTHDMLQTMVGLRSPPIGLQSSASEIFILRDLAVALSACIYQSLCDSDTFIVKQSADTNGCHSPGMETLARLNASCQSTHLMANAGGSRRRRKYSSDEPIAVSTLPSKWPGVTNLRALLAREKDEDTPRLNVLLCEAFMATFMSLLVYGLSTCDCHILYRLAGQKFTNLSWGNLFGGGVKKLLRKASSRAHATIQEISQTSQDTIIENGEATNAESGVWGAVTSITKQRVKLNMKLLGHFGGSQGSPNMKEDKPTYREQFVPPDMSMVSYFMAKPSIREIDDDEYDSADSISSDIDEDEDDDVFADPLNNDPKASQASAAVKKHRRENTEHSNPYSYSWLIMRTAILRIAQNQLQDFIAVAGIEMQELPVASPLTHGVLRRLNSWIEILKEDLAMRGPAPIDFIPGCFIESDIKGPAIHKYRSLLEKHNTPFSPIQASSAPARRLWHFLVRQEPVQDIFIRSVFGKKRTTSSAGDNASVAPSVINDATSGSCVDGHTSDRDRNGQPVSEPVRIIHKDQESISAFCLNNVNPGLISLSTPREVQEMDISLLLESPNWMEDECELDILNLNKDSDLIPSSNFLVIQASSEKSILNQAQHAATNYGVPSSPTSTMAPQSGRGASVIKGATFPGSHDPRFCKLVIEYSKHLLKPVLKHKVDNIKRMCAHPLMPLYLTGGQDGSVQMWEWGHQQVVCTPRPPGTFAKVTRCRFSQHGNKFGIADGDGNLSLWQASLASQSNRSFFTYQCHNKGISDFVFLGSCSLVATAGHSSESKNVGLWDTLLPQKKSLVASFACHEQGASSLIYAPQHQLLISAGKKGDVCIFDVRQRSLRHRFQAHESAIKCLAIDPHEEHFVTGSADGDIRVWGLSVHTSLYTYHGEHAKSSFFKHIGQGVTQIQVDAQGRLFSCGADGSMKVRQLPDRESIVQTLY
ncbi:dmX-like protein 2 isoform X5 [Sitodiplosis mosellana]|uniref:dmX-like protein 2 isoform X5 n=1 Tax=Sitodiplosis mosellana TaxID=263140 RepID=UPI0024446385|nr:dmX-like protein 2 isoform X5 [Sitodiplosis mosellana]XP_055296625.1 dmX-like protein 2 isoform X5 [Sitodiplosis mosellana]XP_055296721.1 dmX-like protein 2 isoform X5 [Sitodiplosis mosellana]